MGTQHAQMSVGIDTSPNTYFNTNPFYTPKDVHNQNVIQNGAIHNQNHIDYDLNINTIKTLLMTTKVPESCVWTWFELIFISGII